MNQICIVYKLKVQHKKLTKSDPPIPILTTSSIGLPVYPIHFLDIT